MVKATLSAAKERLEELLATLPLGEELIIMDGDQPLAVVKHAKRTSWPSKAGSAVHIPHWMSPDFEAPLEEFREYME